MDTVRRNLMKTLDIAGRVWYWWLLSFLSVGALYAHGSIFYTKMPQIVPTRFDDNGKVAETRGKDALFGIYTGLSSAVGLLLALLALATPVFEKSFKVPNQRYWLGEERKTVTFVRTSRLILIIWCLMNLLLMWMFDEVFRFGMACAPDERDLNDQECHDEQMRQMWWPWVGMSVFLVALIVLTFWEMKRFEHIPVTAMERMIPSDAESMWDDARNWRLGCFYYCVEDVRVFVPKRFGMGWTCNMARVWGKALTACIVGSVCVCVVVSLVCAAHNCGK